MPSRTSPTARLGALELWVGDLDSALQTLQGRFGLEAADADLGACMDDEARCLAAGDVVFVVRQGKSPASEVARHVARHGDSIADVTILCDDVGGVVDRALARGLRVGDRDGFPRIDLLGDGTILHTLRDRPVLRQASAGGEQGALGIRAVDHFTYCLPCGTIERVASWYHDLFDLEYLSFQEGAEVGDQVNGMRSAVLRSPAGFALVLTEPIRFAADGQTHRFLRAHAGPGIQHIALSFDDLVAAVEALRSRGVPFMPVHPEHLERSHGRLRDQSLAWEALRRNEILVDSDPDGLLFQLFTLPLTERSSFFLELIERAGATGFGASNVNALFSAVDDALSDPIRPLWRPAKSDAASIDRLVRSASDRIPFYREHLADADTSSLASLPTFDKSLAKGLGRFSLSAGGAAGAHRVLATSGTSGERLYVSFDEIEWDRTGRWLEAVGRRVGLTADDVLLNTHCYGLWVGGPALDLIATRCGAGLVPLGPGPPKLVLELLADGVGTAISATPSYLRRLLEAAQEIDFELSKSSLAFGFIGAEPAEEPFRRKVLSSLPADFRWIELYGLTETGGPSVAFAPDPETAELELNTADFWVEVLDPTADQAVPLGEVGELTLTSRSPSGRTPLIRFRTRDLVKVTAGDVDAPARISRILGRTDDSLKVGGVLVYPSALAEVLSEAVPPTAEWRAYVTHCEPDNELTLEAEAPPEVCREVEQLLRDRVGLGLTVESLAPGALARSRHKEKRILVDSSGAGLKAAQ